VAACAALGKLRMATGTVIIEMLNMIFLTLTPVERWQAARRFKTSFLTENWFFLTTAAALIALAILLLWVSYRRIMEARKATKQVFVERAKRRRLSVRESQILLEIAGKSRLKRSDAIFTMRDAFDRGARKMMKEHSAKHKAEESKNLMAELSLLRRKLGFEKQAHWLADEKVSSRKIPVGKTLYMARRTSHTSESVESTVIKNNDKELTVKLKLHTKITFAETWLVHYCSGASVWEFDTSVVSCDGDILVLNHNDRVRFINRRRFLRVPANRPAFIAHFPFAKTLLPKSEKSVTGTSKDLWAPPEFVPAVVTELGGPGLRIEAPLEANAGDRLLVTFKLDEQENRVAGSKGQGRATPPKIIESVAMVTHTEAAKNGWSIAVELTGLSDLDVNELIRATNAVYSRADGGTHRSRRSTANRQDAEDGVAEPVGVQGT